MSATPFRLFDLPKELSDKILDFYYEGIRIEIRPERNSIPNGFLNPSITGITIRGHPSLALERTSHRFCLDSRAARDRKRPQELQLGDDEFQSYEVRRFLNMITTKPYCEWFRCHTTKIYLSYSEHAFGRRSTDWIELLSRFPRLQEVMLSARHTRKMSWAQVAEVAKDILESAVIKEDMDFIVLGEYNVAQDVASAMEKLHPGRNQVICELDMRCKMGLGKPLADLPEIRTYGKYRVTASQTILLEESTDAKKVMIAHGRPLG